MSSAAQQSSAAQANNYDAGDHHTPIQTERIPSSTGTGAGLASTTPSTQETHTHSHSSTPLTGSATTEHSSASGLGQEPTATAGATTGHSAAPGHSSSTATGRSSAAASGTGNHNTSEAAAGLGSDPWEGKELPSQQAQNADIAAHEGGAGGNEELGEDGYPVQKHAGSVGLGPNYKKHPNTADKIGGTVEEIKGKILRKPEVVEHGHDRKTGELEHKKAAADDAADPFKTEADATDSKPNDTPAPANSALPNEQKHKSEHSQGFTSTSAHTTASGGAPGAVGTTNVATGRTL